MTQIPGSYCNHNFLMNTQQCYKLELVTLIAPREHISLLPADDFVRSTNSVNFWPQFHVVKRSRLTGCPRPATQWRSAPSPAYGSHDISHWTDLQSSHDDIHLPKEIRKYTQKCSLIIEYPVCVFTWSWSWSWTAAWFETKRIILHINMHTAVLEEHFGLPHNLTLNQVLLYFICLPDGLRHTQTTFDIWRQSYTEIRTSAVVVGVFLLIIIRAQDLLILLWEGRVCLTWLRATSTTMRLWSERESSMVRARRNWKGRHEGRKERKRKRRRVTVGQRVRRCWKGPERNRVM